MFISMRPNICKLASSFDRNAIPFDVIVGESEMHNSLVIENFQEGHYLKCSKALLKWKLIKVVSLNLCLSMQCNEKLNFLRILKFANTMNQAGDVRITVLV